MSHKLCCCVINNRNSARQKIVRNNLTINKHKRGLAVVIKPLHIPDLIRAHTWIFIIYSSLMKQRYSSCIRVCVRGLRTRAQSRRGRSDSYRRPRGAKNFFFFFFPEEKSALVCCISCKRRKLCVILDYKSQQRRIEVGGVAGGRELIRLPHAAILNFRWRLRNARGFFLPHATEEKSRSRGWANMFFFSFDSFQRTVERVFSKPFDFFFCWEGARPSR